MRFRVGTMPLSNQTDVEFHSFHWDNFSPKVLEMHAKVMQHFNIDIKYTQKNISHGEWLDEVLKNAKCKVVVIIEPDLIPLNREIIDTAIEYVICENTFLGCAQVSNHIAPATHIYAAPSFFVISLDCYKKLGYPSFKSIPSKADVAENISYIAEQKGIRYRTLFPTCFEKAPKEGAWPLASYGHYGIGTVFSNSVYHLFQSRLQSNIDLFVKRCDEVLQGKFDTTNFIPSTTFHGIDKVVPIPKPRKKFWFAKI